MNETEFGSAFWITITGLLLTFMGTIATYCLKSKCKSCSLCCGAIIVDRDVQTELEEEKMEIEHGIKPLGQETSMNSKV